jgi:TolB-like protein
VGVAYVVASWLLLQITDVLVSLMGLPEFAGKLVVMLVAIGFIPVMIFSWAYEVTPEGIKRESEVERSESVTRETATRLNRITIGLLITVAALVLVDRFMPGQPGDEPESTANVSAETPRDATGDPSTAVVEEIAAAAVTTPSVAVLPFVNMSADEENEYFSDGISEELLNLLVRIEGLRVPSRTSSFAFKGQNMDIRDIAKQLEVGHVLEGSVRKAGNRVRITAQLIDVTTDTHMWSDTYDRELEDIFAIQGEIALQIVEALKLTLAPSISDHKPTGNMEAYNSYLQGLYQFRRREGNTLIDAETYLRKSVELDPEFAESWAALALTYSVQPNYMDISTAQIEPLALDAAAQAERLKPELVEPALARGNLLGKHGKLVESVKMYEEAVNSSPKHPLARMWLSIDLLIGGFLEESLEHLVIALEQDPAAGIIHDWIARAYYLTGNPQAGFEHGSRSLGFGRGSAAVALLNYHLDRQEYEQIRALIETLPVYPFFEAWRKLADAKENPELVDEVLDWSHQLAGSAEDKLGIAAMVLNAQLGDIEYMLELLTEAKNHDATWYVMLWYPNTARVREHPAFKQFAREHGLLELWQARGWPDLCRPLGDEDFECD